MHHSHREEETPVDDQGMRQKLDAAEVLWRYVSFRKIGDPSSAGRSLLNLAWQIKDLDPGRALRAAESLCKGITAAAVEDGDELRHRTRELLDTLER